MNDQLQRRLPTALWFVAVLLALFAILMASHLSMLWFAVYRCDTHARLRIEMAIADHKLDGQEVPDQIKPAAICGQLTGIFNEVAKLYMSTILALLSGAGFSAGTALYRKKGDDP